MLSVRLPKTIERDLAQFCAVRKMTKSQVVQVALAQYLVAAQTPTKAKPGPEPDLSFLAADDPIRQFIGLAKVGPSTDQWMAITRGEDWNQK